MATLLELQQELARRHGGGGPSIVDRFTDELERRQASSAPKPQPSSTVGGAIGRGFLNTALGNLAQIPAVVAEALAGPPQTEFDKGAASLSLIPGPLDLAKRGLAGLASGIRSITPSSQDIRAGISTLAEGVGLTESQARERAAEKQEGQPPSQGLGLAEKFQRAREDVQATDERVRAEHPFAMGTGEVAGDIATLLAARRPFRGVPVAQAAPVIASRAQTTLGRALQNTARALQNTGSRAVKTGAEGAFLASLQGADPSEVGAIAAGSQAAGEAIGNATIASLKKVPFWKAVLGATLLTITAKEIIPGGFQIVEQTLKDRAWEIGLAALLGGGALKLSQRDLVPKGFGGPALAELANTTKRGALLSLLASYKKEPELVGPVAEKFAEDPNYFGEQAQRRLTRAFSDEKADAGRIIKDLMKDRDFRARFDALGNQK